MPDDTITHTPAEENLWFKLAIMSNASEPSNRIWNGYMRHLMENNGKRIEADKVRVILNDGTEGDYQEGRLSKLMPDELKEVQDIKLPGDMPLISFVGCDFGKDADFASFYFPTDVYFENARFNNIASFKKASFAGFAFFKNASFGSYVGFENASFASEADFTDAIFENTANFEKASFAELANFSRAELGKSEFMRETLFRDASFASEADFTDARFFGSVDFKKANFGDKANFVDARFKNTANFEKASFADWADFSRVEFASEANFSASSDTSTHKGRVSFANATFKLAPSFFERQLHKDTDWQDIIWPEPSSKEQAGIYVRRYQCLSLMMSELGKYDDMHTFFRSSMQAKEIRDGRRSVTFFISLIYRAFDYGWGVGHAFKLWASHIFLGFVFILGLMFVQHSWIDIYDVIDDVGKSFVLSFSNAHRFIGLHSGALEKLYEAANEAKGDFPWFNFIWGVQTVIGLPLLFFLLLTFRNRFRMR